MPTKLMNTQVLIHRSQSILDIYRQFIANTYIQPLQPDIATGWLVFKEY